MPVARAIRALPVRKGLRRRPRSLLPSDVGARSCGGSRNRWRSSFCAPSAPAASPAPCRGRGRAARPDLFALGRAPLRAERDASATLLERDPLGRVHASLRAAPFRTRARVGSQDVSELSSAESSALCRWRGHAAHESPFSC